MFVLIKRKKISIIIEDGIKVYKNHRCECPCNKRIPYRKSQKCHGIPRFIYGHQFKGKHHSTKSLKKMSKNRTGKCAKEEHPNWGKSLPYKVRKKISKTLKGRHCSPRTEFTENTIINGMTLSEAKQRENLSLKTRRKNSKSKQGENNPNWLGGISFLPYCYKFNDRLKNAVRKRDNYTCQRCDKKQKKHGKKLCVHHIHFDKENCYPDLISLCNKCHLIVNHKRNSSERKFMKNLKERNLLNWSC